MALSFKVCQSVSEASVSPDQISTPMLKPVLGGVHSTSMVAPPDDGRLCTVEQFAKPGWCPSKPARCATSTLHSSSLQHQVGGPPPILPSRS